MAILSRWKNIWQSFRRSKSLENLTKNQILKLTATKIWPSWGQWKQLGRFLSTKEKKILTGSLVIASLSSLTLIGELALAHRLEIPAVGGEYTEGLVGTPQFINPLYSSASDVDSDLTKLIYSGLFKWTESSGLVPDLAESYIVSEDQKTYTVKIKNNAKWHNGDPVRSSDILFTIQSIQNPAYHSPLVSAFRGVQISEVDEQTVQFVLEEPFAPFLSTLTVGILPSSLWAEIPPKNVPINSLNLSPIGSGPYKFEKFIREKNGEIRSYSLVRFNEFYNQPAKIEKLSFKFYSDFESAVAALTNQNIEGLNFVPNHLIGEVQKNRSVNLLTPSMPQEVSLFFNQETQPLLKDANLRQALALTIDKSAIVNNVLGGRGAVIEAPILPGMIGYYPEVAKISPDLIAAAALLDKTDYTEISPDNFRTKKIKKTENGETTETLEELTLNLTTVNQPEFIKTAELIAEQAKAVGFKIQIETVEASEFYTNIIKPRAYQILLTATQFGLDPDPYPFWHSSQIKDPGLNLAQYANKKVDDLLEKARLTSNSDERTTAYKEFQDLLVKDLPAIFLYQPAYTYAISNKIKNVSLTAIHSPADRFQFVTDWYIKTRQVFK
ncbi:MAG: peptide ABC transporter substrate-binding protein [Candidatus Uhrbacteria bacterium]